jgi:16S rRNA (guanine527-N7)-methyltransferase
MKEILKNYLDAMKINTTEEQLDKFCLHQEMLASWNEKINLTAITEPGEVALKHFADCIYAACKIPEGASLIDVGSGAGFPGVPLKIMRPDISVLLLDSLNKRINFLNELISALGLEKIETMHTRAEDGAKKELRESFDIATARAVANLTVLSEYCMPYVKVGGKFLAYKGSAGENEVLDAKNAIATLGGKLIGTEEYILPGTDIRHTLVSIEKIKPTPIIYPRSPGKISKNPLK